jgi:hypothetical protein
MKTQDYLDSVLSDAEKAHLASFYDNEVMREAVKKVILSGIYSNGALKKGEPADPLRNYLLGFPFQRPELSNEQIGADLRASVSAINTLEVAFSNIARYKSEPERSPKKTNQAR